MALFSCILKTVFASTDSFFLITSHIDMAEGTHKLDLLYTMLPGGYTTFFFLKGVGMFGASKWESKELIVLQKQGQKT